MSLREPIRGELWRGRSGTWGEWCIARYVPLIGLVELYLAGTMGACTRLRSIEQLNRDYEPTADIGHRDPRCGCCGHARSMHGADQGRCFDPRGRNGRCLCHAFTPPFDSTRAPDGRPGIYLQVTTPLGPLPPSRTAFICKRCGVYLELHDTEQHDCGLRGERDVKPPDATFRAIVPENTQRFLDAHRDWVSTPPVVPGHYWACSEFGQPTPVRVSQLGAWWEAVGENLCWRWRNHPPSWLWWPVPLEPPVPPPRRP